MAQTAQQKIIPPSMPAFARKPLTGITILLVEDSSAASEALRLLAVREGARLRRADCLHSASRHLGIFRPNVVMVDLGLPDGNGLGLISEMARKAVPCPALIAISGGDPSDWGPKAIEAGAHAIMAKPLSRSKDFRDVILSVVGDRAA